MTAKSAFFTGAGAGTEPAAPQPPADHEKRIATLRTNLEFLAKHGICLPVAAVMLADSAFSAEQRIREVEAQIHDALEGKAEQRRQCNLCPVMIWFVRTREGKLMPFCYDGTPHWANWRQK